MQDLLDQPWQKIIARDTFFIILTSSEEVKVTGEAISDVLRPVQRYIKEIIKKCFQYTCDNIEQRCRGVLGII